MPLITQVGFAFSIFLTSNQHMEEFEGTTDSNKKIGVQRGIRVYLGLFFRRSYASSMQK